MRITKKSNGKEYELIALWRGQFEYQAINSKTGKPWQAIHWNDPNEFTFVLVPDYTPVDDLATR